jgi:hypothetical protein
LRGMIVLSAVLIRNLAFGIKSISESSKAPKECKSSSLKYLFNLPAAEQSFIRARKGAYPKSGSYSPDSTWILW